MAKREAVPASSEDDRQADLTPEDPSFVTYLTVRQAMNSLRRLQDRYVENQPSSEIQSYVCAMIVRAGHPLPMGHIARFLCLEPQTITGLVSRMEDKGLVHRTRSKEDGRRVLVDVTEAGRERFEQAMKLTRTVRRDAFAGLSMEEHVRLADVMLGIRDMALQALGEDPEVINGTMRQIFSPEMLEPFAGHLRATDEEPGLKARSLPKPVRQESSNGAAS